MMLRMCLESGYWAGIIEESSRLTAGIAAPYNENIVCLGLNILTLVGYVHSIMFAHCFRISGRLRNKKSPLYHNFLFQMAVQSCMKLATLLCNHSRAGGSDMTHKLVTEDVKKWYLVRVIANLNGRIRRVQWNDFVSEEDCQFLLTARRTRFRSHE